MVDQALGYTNGGEYGVIRVKIALYLANNISNRAACIAEQVYTGKFVHRCLTLGRRGGRWVVERLR